MLEEKDNLEIYELGYHLLPTVQEEDVPAEISKINFVISENEGNIIGEGLPSMRQLAYEVVKKVETKTLKFNKAYFGWVKFEIDRSQITNIKNQIESLPSVLRFIIIKTVRENTMYTPKAPVFKKEKPREEISQKTEEKQKASKAEIDKSIDELLINEN